ncbi:BZ3500_MvSof-1268-A1-R1_Chr3-1g05668 [Microbotryum saponariae]|uniref:BZ3500_MvSof-1268-A1-R1_Chr3-1g05668 protein n=1 Tax=Microbotryum saponariae TaxID=289078 RepID=A0A2X0LII9_9BASI|nr:BZ3500_MvSof-1268-A1-R1_Chr3-1g05668 [Microbotryum saponariae]SDA04858.1 BZ3501_MvSof-1269-A2-R1_Chr3-1g05338 [Microbotryum saponariae]
MRPFSSIILATCALVHLTIANSSTTIKDHAFSLNSVRLQGSLGHSLGRLDLVQESTCQRPNPDVSYTETTVEDDGDSPTPPLCASIEAVDLQEPTRRIVPVKFGKSIESERASRDVFPKRLGSKFRRAQTLLSRSEISSPLSPCLCITFLPTDTSLVSDIRPDHQDPIPHYRKASIKA